MATVLTSMSRSQRERNLTRLLEGLDAYARDNGITAPNPPPPEAVTLSASCFLAHSTSDDSFAAICASNQLLSPAELARQRGEALRPDSAEAILDTGKFVFLYAAPFRYPHTGCGLLFAVSLEHENREEGVATPFDSGGLKEVFSRADPAEAPRAFLSRHELPLPEHRDYLRQTMILLFGHPLDYLDGREPRWPGPLGLTGGDQRRWTHEVRIPERAWVQTGQLQAVFVRTALAAGDADIKKLCRWCELEGTDLIEFDTPRGNDFEALQRECVAYMRQKLLV